METELTPDAEERRRRRVFRTQIGALGAPSRPAPDDEQEYQAAQQRRDALLALPAVAAIRRRLAEATDKERAALRDAYLPHFRTYRTAQSELWHRCVKAYGEHWRDVFAVTEKMRRDDRAALDAAERGPYDWDWAADAAADAVKAALFAELLTVDEARVWSGPWRTVLGDPAAVAEQGGDTFVSGWAAL